VDKEKCSVLVNGKECGLDLIEDETEEAKMVGLHRCALGHRVYVISSKRKTEPAKSKSEPPSNQSKH
jgi:hypothetical protein